VLINAVFDEIEHVAELIIHQNMKRVGVLHLNRLDAWHLLDFKLRVDLDLHLHHLLSPSIQSLASKNRRDTHWESTNSPRGSLPLACIV
jgi:hypothetical protein